MLLDGRFLVGDLVTQTGHVGTFRGVLRVLVALLVGQPARTASIVSPGAELDGLLGRRWRDELEVAEVLVDELQLLVAEPSGRSV